MEYHEKLLPDKMVRMIAGIHGGFECAVLGLGHEEGNSRQEISQQCWRTLISQMTLHYCHLISMTCTKRLGDCRRKQPEYDSNLMRESVRHKGLSVLVVERTLWWIAKK